MSEKEKIVVDAAFMVDDRKTMPCTVAIYLSQEYNISLKEIGETCDNYGIKITDCRLGCFK